MCDDLVANGLKVSNRKLLGLALDLLHRQNVNTGAL
jgi:hypothetical protein